MAFFKHKRFIKCKPNEDNTGVQCVAYEPDKSGNKTVVATAEFNTLPDGEISTLAHDGDVDEIDNLTSHALKYLKKKKQTSGDF